MSKRYGRNQKRRHRERIAELEKLYHSADALAEWHCKEREKYQNLYDELIKDIRNWWDNSVLLDVKTERVVELPPYYRMVQREPIKAWSVAMMTDSVIELHEQTLEALRIAAYEDYGERSVHVKLEADGKRIGYYVSKDVFDAFGTPPARVAQEVIRNVLFEFGKLFNKDKNKM
jgi:hypothetical protein